MAECLRKIRNTLLKSIKSLEEIFLHLSSKLSNASTSSKTYGLLFKTFENGLRHLRNVYVICRVYENMVIYSILNMVWKEQNWYSYVWHKFLVTFIWAVPITCLNEKEDHMYYIVKRVINFHHNCKDTSLMNWNLIFNQNKLFVWFFTIIDDF